MARNKRRSPGEGSIYQRKDGLWVAQYKVESPSGKKTKYIYGKVRKVVAAKLAKAIAERDSGIVYDAGTLTLGTHLDQWLGFVQDALKPSTFERYEQTVRIHIKPTLGRVKLSRLNAPQIQKLYKNKLATGLAPRTVQIIHATLHKALKQAVRWLLISSNATEAVTPPRYIKKEIDALDKEQIKTLLKAAEDDKLCALYVLAVTTGMRKGELLGLQRKDINLDAGTLRVNRTIYNGTVSTPKTNSSRRTIRLSKLAIRALKDHRVENAKQQMISEWVFSTSVGTPISVHNLHSRSWKPLLKKAGLPHSTRFHDLRHSAATLLLGQGVAVKVVSEMLGHADISTTLSIYAHVLPDMQSTAADEMDDALREDDQDEATELQK